MGEGSQEQADRWCCVRHTRRLCDTAAITTLNPNSSSPQPNILPRPTAQTPAMDDSPPSTLTPPHNGSRFIDNTSVAQPKVDLSIPVVESKPLPPRPIAQHKVPHDTTSVVNPIIDSSPVRPTTPTTPTLPSLDWLEPIHPSRMSHQTWY